MSRCEDWPCCGHESGCCPDYRNGRQINMRCTCGAVVPLGSRSSLCDRCLNSPMDDDYDHYERYDEFDSDDGHGGRGEAVGRCECGEVIYEDDYEHECPECGAPAGNCDPFRET